MNDAFDKQIRDAIASRRYDLDPDHRAAMEELLRKRERRRPLIIWWMGAGLAGLLVLAGLLLLRRPATTGTKDDTQPVEVTIADAGNRNEKPGSLLTADTPAGASSIADDETMQQASSHTSNDEKDTQTGRHTTSDIQAGRPATAIRSADPPKSRDAATGTPEISRPDLTQTTRPSARIPNSNAPVTTSAIHIETPATTSPVTSVPALSERPVPTIPSYVETEPAEAGEAEPAMIHREKIAVAGLEAIPGTRIPLAQHRLQPEVKPVSGKPWYLFAEAGGGLIPRHGVTYPAGWSAAAGAGMGFSLVPRLEAMVSVGYWVQDGGFSFLRESTVREAGFGIRSAFHRLMPDRLHHAYVRAGFQYRLRHHLLSARAGLLYLYGAQGNIAVQTYDQIPGQTKEETSYAWLNTDGLRRWKAQGEITYGYQLTPRIALAAGVLWRPGSILREDPSLAAEGFTWKGRAANIQGLLSLQYRIYGHR